MKTQTKDRTDVSYFLLRLTPDEKTKLNNVAKHKKTTMTSLIRFLLVNNKTIESIYNEILIQE